MQTKINALNASMYTNKRAISLTNDKVCRMINKYMYVQKKA